MPRPLIETTRRPRPVYGNNTGDEVGRASKSEGDGTVELETLNDGWELGAVSVCAKEQGIRSTYEILEAVRGKMHVLHKHKDPDSVVAKSFLETLNGGDLATFFDSIALDALVRQDSFFRCEPTSNGWIIGKEPCSDNGDYECEDA